MKKSMSSNKFIRKFFIAAAAIMFFVALATYIVDPFMYYRITKNRYLLNSGFVNAGLIKNYDYDTVVIGSSMIENFNMDSIRKKLNCKPLKLPMGGITIASTELLYKLCSERNIARNYIINLDTTQFNKEDDSIQFPKYLYNKNPIDDVKYLWGYEAVTKFIPVDLATSALYSIGFHLPQKFDYSTQIDYIEDWSLDATFGKELVIKEYLLGQKTVSKQNTDKMMDRMLKRLDLFIKNMEIESDKNYVFILPPYSALYWYHSQEQGYGKLQEEFSKYLVQRFEKYENVRIVCMYDLDETTDLDHYTDMTHFDPYIQEKIVDAIKTKAYDLTKDNMEHRMENLELLTKSFADSNGSWLK